MCLVSCKSGPDNTEAITALDLEITALRQKNMDMEFDTEYPEDWKDAEDSYATAKTAVEAKQEDVLTLLGQTLDKYQAIYKKGSDNLETSLKKKLISARDSALGSGAESLFASQLQSLDEQTTKTFEASKVKAKTDSKDTIESSQSQSQTNLVGTEKSFSSVVLNKDLISDNPVTFADMKNSINFYKKQTAGYTTLSTLSEAFPLKSKILENEFSSYDEDQWALSESAYNESLTLLKSDPASAVEKASVAKAGYQDVLDTAYTVLGKKAEDHLLDEKTGSDALKASVAMKDEYKTAKVAYNKALQSRKDSLLEQSYNEMTEAAAQFQFINEQTAIKKANAELAISVAKANQSEVSELAKQADIVAPLEGEDLPEYELPPDTTESVSTNIENGTEGSEATNSEIVSDESEEDRDTRLFLESIEGVRK